MAEPFTIRFSQTKLRAWIDSHGKFWTLKYSESCEGAYPAGNWLLLLRSRRQDILTIRMAPGTRGRRPTWLWQQRQKIHPTGRGLVCQSLQLITRIGCEGIAMVEYMRMANGRLALMEINGRLWALSVLPLPAALITGATWSTEHPPWTSGKLSWQQPSIRPTLVRMVIPRHLGTCYDDLWISDLRPGIAGLKNWFQVRAKSLSMGSCCCLLVR